MRFISLLIIIILIGSLLACKKDKQDIPKDEKPIEQSFYKNLKIDSVQQLSIVVSFQLTKDAKDVGIVTALDSAYLINELASYMERKAVYQNDRYYTKIEWPYNLPPTDDIIWFRIYAVDEKGVRTYSPVFSQRISTYEIKNKFIVKGKGAYNKHPKDFFMNYDGGIVGIYDNSLIVNAVTNDVNIQNYNATLNGTPISVGSIDPRGYPLTHQQIIFDVPDDYPLGPATFKLYYQNKLVYNYELTIVNGGLLTKDQYVLPHTSWMSIFTFNNELYTIRIGATISEYKFHKWNPNSKAWTLLSNPSYEPKFGNILTAHAVDGIIYFSPTEIRPWTIFGDNKTYPYTELLTTFNPSTNSWGEIELLYTTNPNLDRGLDVLESFVIKDNIYYIIRESPRIGITSRCVLKVFNVKNRSWEELMELPNKFYKASVLNEQVYLLTTDWVNQQYDASSNFKNEFFILDINKKSLAKKSWISHKNAGVFRPYLISFNGKIYVYGGYYSLGYVSLYSSIFAVYDPIVSQWAPVIGDSYFTGWVNQTDGFMFPINGKLYLGLGLDRYTNGNIYGAKANNSIYQMTLK